MDTMKSRFELLLLKIFSLFLTCLVTACSEEISSQKSDWPLYGRDYSNQRYSPLKQINKTNIDQLSLAWKFNTGKKATFQTNPIVIDGIMYITTPFNDVIALNAETGTQRCYLGY
jgi:glucose dehydrogenase